jgi:hypothetical protein
VDRYRRPGVDDLYRTCRLLAHHGHNCAQERRAARVYQRPIDVRVPARDVTQPLVQQRIATALEAKAAFFAGDETRRCSTSWRCEARIPHRR